MITGLFIIFIALIIIGTVLPVTALATSKYRSQFGTSDTLENLSWILSALTFLPGVIGLIYLLMIAG